MKVNTVDNTHSFEEKGIPSRPVSGHLLDRLKGAREWKNDWVDGDDTTQ